MSVNKLTFKRINLTKIRFSLTSESCFAFLLAMLWANNTLVTYVKAVLMRIPYVSAFSEHLVSLVFVVALLLSLPYMSKHIAPKWILVYLGIAFVYLLNLFVFPDNQTALMENMYPFLVKALPLIFVGMCVNLKKHYNLLYIISLVSVVLRFFHLLLDPINMINGAMNASYEMLPHVCLVIVTALAKANVVNIVVSVLGVVITFAFGTRGPIFCILFLVLTYLVVFKKVYKRVWLFSLLTIVILSIVFFYEEIIVMLLGTVERMGMSTRIFDRLLNGTLIESSGRDLIRATLFEAIGDNLFGYGIAGDRAIVGTYAHNILIELWVSFGVFIGSALFIVPIFFATKLLLQKSKNVAVEDGFILALISACYIKLFLSGTYLTEMFLFLLIGVIVAEYKQNNKAL